MECVVESGARGKRKAHKKRLKIDMPNLKVNERVCATLIFLPIHIGFLPINQHNNLIQEKCLFQSEDIIMWG
jgi:hypothetical protein